MAFARLNIGADFGGRAPAGGFTEEGLRAVSPTGASVQALNDVHGMTVFKCQPPQIFMSVGPVRLVVGKPEERVVQVLEAAHRLGVGLSEEQQLAYDLYSASFFEDSVDARFMLLMMSLETLMRPEPRPPVVAELVNDLIFRVEQSGIAENEIASLVGSLKWLHKESIGQAGRRMAQSLGDRRYMDEPASVFFTRCYTMRSQLAHGHMPRPTRDQVSVRGASLELYLSHLLGLELLDQFDF